MKRIKFRATRDGMSVLEVLEENGLSHKIIKSLKAKGNIRKDEKIIYLKKELKENDFITLIFDDEESKIYPKDMNINIVYEDNEMLVINKDYGISVMSTMALKEDTLLNGIMYYLKENNIESKVHIINRLDRYTTGLMVVALNRFSASNLSLSLKNSLRRKYYAIVKGILDKKEDTISLKIAKESLISTRRCVRNDGKESITKYKVIKEIGNYSILDIELLTGRTHQIRVVFSFLNHPLLGDDLYDKDYNGEELMLHSYYLEFIHPIKKEKIVLDIGLSDRQKDFLQSIE